MGAGFVLVVIRPAEGEAKYGKAAVHDGLLNRLRAAQKGADVLIEAGVPEQEAHDFAAYDLWRPTKVGVFVEHAGSGFTFRIDTPDAEMHTCSCCGRLIWNSRAHCSGCCTRHRDTPACCVRDHGIPACLPENSAHSRRA